jgi:selT/selW/selH-like putative selenoprotein
VEAEVKERYPDATINLIEGAGGIFDVECDGTVVFSKQKVEGNRFPDDGEIVKLIGKVKS